MDFLKGFPITDKTTGTYGVIESVYEDYIVYVYCKDKFFFKNTCDKKQCEITNVSYMYIPVVLRVINIESSCDMFGSRQKYEDFINSTLPIVELGTRDGQYYFILKTFRKNGDILRILYENNMEIIFPTIITPEKIESILKIQEKSFVKLKSKSKKYDLYKDKKLLVKKIHLINNFSDMNILELEDFDKNIIMEQQKNVTPWDMK